MPRIWPPDALKSDGPLQKRAAVDVDGEDAEPLRQRRKVLKKPAAAQRKVSKKPAAAEEDPSDEEPLAEEPPVEEELPVVEEEPVEEDPSDEEPLLRSHQLRKKKRSNIKRRPMKKPSAEEPPVPKHVRKKPSSARRAKTRIYIETLLDDCHPNNSDSSDGPPGLIPEASSSES